MSDEIKTEITLSTAENTKELKCEFGDKKLKDCVDLEDFKKLSLPASDIVNTSIIKCLETMLNTCIGTGNKLKLGTTFIKITLNKKSNENWEINGINLDLNPNIDDELLLTPLKQCLSFFNVSCISRKSVNFSFTFSKNEPALKQYKSELLKLKDELEVVLGRELNF